MALFLLCPSGSHGDVHPFLAIGKALRARGHRVAMSTSAHFESLALAAGFDFDAVGTETDFQETVNDPNLWHPSKSLSVIFDKTRFPRLLRESYQHIQSRYVPGETVAVAGSLAIGARIAHDALGVPLATVHLQPMGIASATDPPIFPGGSPGRWWPTWLTRFYYWVGERIVLDSMLSKTVNGLRHEQGLKPIRRIWGPWRHSSQCILGLFPDWFGTARDWPSHMFCTGFVRYDQSDLASTSPALESFLSEGDLPVVISFGSAMRTGRAHFEAALAACASLGLRAVLLAKGGDQIPPLPPNAIHADYAPFSQVFPRAKAVMHHGGIGTSAQALAAGVPQLVMPLAFDQFDNAARLVNLGVARSLPARRFTMKSAANTLESLLKQTTECKTMKARMQHDAMQLIVEKLEALVNRDSQREPHAKPARTI